jgi:hypothetical protein
MNDNIILLHMADGKSVIGRVSYEASDMLVIERPCEIVIVPAQSKSAPPQLMYAPYLTMYGALPSIETLEVKSIHVIHKREAPPKLVDGYVEVTSGLTIARSL